MINRVILFSAFLLSTLYSCFSVKKYEKNISEGHISFIEKLYIEKEEVPLKYAAGGLQVWYKDSNIIYEITNLYSKSVDDVEVEFGVKLKNYTFLDLRTMIFYDYNSLSDTATLIRCYTLPDSEYVAWNFYYSKRFLQSYNNFLSLPDTNINNITYKRLLKSHTYDNNYDSTQSSFTVVYTYFMQCNRKGSIFHIDRTFDDTINICPATRLDIYYVGKENKVTSGQIEFISDTLSKDESKVFKKWIENAKSPTLRLKHYKRSIDIGRT